MTKEEADLQSKRLNDEVDKYSAVLNSFEKGVMGLTPDHVRETQEYNDADKAYKVAFANLRNFNAWYVKEFMKKKK